MSLINDNMASIWIVFYASGELPISLHFTRSSNICFVYPYLFIHGLHGYITSSQLPVDLIAQLVSSSAPTSQC